MNFRLTFFAAALVATSACGPRLIPGTDLNDTDDTRAILKVMEIYRAAVEARDAQRVISLVADSFKDDLGTASPEDDLDYAGLRAKLPQSLARLEDVHLEMNVRKVDVDTREKVARAIFTYTTSFRMPGLSAKPQNDSEIKEMHFKQVGDQWKILSGI